VVAGALAALLVGCGSDGPGASTGGAGTGGGAAGTGGVFTWKEDGAMKTTIYPSGTRTTSSMLDMVQIAGGDATGTGLAMGVTLRPPPLAAGTFDCASTGMNGLIVSAAYTKTNATVGFMATCSITITTLGAATGDRLIGTFSATFTGSGAPTVTLTDGKFDVPLTVSKPNF
jgi:hypothetical protein